MGDIAGKVFAIIFAVWIMFMVPITVFALKQDVTIQNYVDDATREFVDISRTTGTISEASYNSLINRLDKTGNVYDVTITDYREKYYPVQNADGTSDYESGMDAVVNDDILKAIYGTGNGNDATGKYVLHDGDYLKVEVKNRNATLGRKMLSTIFLSRSEGGQIYSSYGGYVGGGNG